MRSLQVGFLLSLLVAVSEVLAQAPGDYDPTCRTGLNAPNHIFPEAWRVLVDTYDYENLYNPFEFGNVRWITADIDGDFQEV